MEDVKFKVLKIVRSPLDSRYVKLTVKFDGSDKEYTYSRKVRPGSKNSQVVIIDGCKVIFTDNKSGDHCDLVRIVREYSTKGKKKLSTESQFKKPLPPPRKVQWDGWDGDGDGDGDESNRDEFIDSDDLCDDDEWEELEKQEEEQKLLSGDVHHDKYDMIKTCLECGIPVYLAGPAGSGKNHTVEQIAKELGWNFYFSNSVQQEYKLTGFIDAGGDFHETEFYKACNDDRECIFFLDEIDASIPEVLVLLNAAIANGYFEFPNGRVDFDKVHFVAAGNTVGSGADDMYTGRMVLDQATLDRFAIIEFDYCELIEKKVTKNNIELISFIHELREITKRKGIRATFSYRCMSMVTKLENAGMNLEDVLKIAVLKGLDKDTINTLYPIGNTRYHSAFNVVLAHLHS